MSLNSEEIYREKYLKYKKKYTLALENMEGGGNPLTKDSIIYFVTKESYDKLILARTDRSNLITSTFNRNDDCFLERLKKFGGLVLTQGLIDISLKTIDGKDVNKVLDHPFLYGRKFGKKEKYKSTNDKTKVETESNFDVNFALNQLKESQPILLKCLQDIINEKNNNLPTGGKSTFLAKEVWYLHISDKKISYNGKLEYAMLQIDNSSAQSGGGNLSYMFCNPASYAAICSYYGLNHSMTSVKLNASCIIDAARYPINEGDEPIFAILQEGKKNISVQRYSKSGNNGVGPTTNTPLDKIPDLVKEEIRNEIKIKLEADLGKDIKIFKYDSNQIVLL